MKSDMNAHHNEYVKGEPSNEDLNQLRSFLLMEKDNGNIDAFFEEEWNSMDIRPSAEDDDLCNKLLKKFNSYKEKYTYIPELFG